MEEAIRELEASLSMATSAKAEFYLDKVRKSLIEREGSDKRPPEIIIISPRQNLLSNSFSVVVQGIAKDDAFVRHITVGGKEVRIDVSNQEIPFSMEVPLSPGENRIPVLTADLTGKTSETFVMVNVDCTGPVVSIDEPYGDNPVAGTEIVLKGYAFDDSGVAGLSVNGQSFPYNERPKELEFRETVRLQPGQKYLAVKIRDGAGNVTSARVGLSDRAKEAGLSNLLAENTISEEIRLSDRPKMLLCSDLLTQKTSADRIPPDIGLRNTEKRVTYLDQAVIEGTVTDNDKVRTLFIDREKISKILSTPRGKFHFSYVANLREGENLIEIRATDVSGNSGFRRVSITRKVPKAQRIDSRLELAVSRFDRNDPSSSEGFEYDLEYAMTEGGRFLIRKLIPGHSGSEDADAVLKMGKRLDIDYILFGYFLRRNNNVTIYTWLRDTETGKSMLNEDLVMDVYEEDVDADDLKSMAHKMNLKLADALPLLEGVVIKKTEGRLIIVDIGGKDGVIRDMKLVVYDLGEPIVDSDTKEVLDWNDKLLGEARIRNVREKTSVALLDEGANKEAIRAEHRVITR